MEVVGDKIKCSGEFDDSSDDSSEDSSDDSECFPHALTLPLHLLVTNKALRIRQTIYSVLFSFRSVT